MATPPTRYTAELTDPVCGMPVTAASPHCYVHGGALYCFCSTECCARFAADPPKYVRFGRSAGAPPARTNEDAPTLPMGMSLPETPTPPQAGALPEVTVLVTLLPEVTASPEVRVPPQAASGADAATRRDAPTLADVPTLPDLPTYTPTLPDVPTPPEVGARARQTSAQAWQGAARPRPSTNGMHHAQAPAGGGGPAANAIRTAPGSPAASRADASGTLGLQPETMTPASALRSLMSPLFSWLEARYAAKTSREMVRLYRQVSGRNPGLSGRPLYREVVIARTGWDIATADALLDHAQDSFASWPAETELAFRDVVHYLAVSDFLASHVGSHWVRANMGRVVSSYVPHDL